MKYKAYFISLWFLVLGSCTSSEVEIEFPQVESSIVVFSTITPYILPTPKPLNLYLSWSCNLQDTNLYYENKATVMLYEDGLLLDSIESYNSLGMYHFDLQPKISSLYSIEVILDDTLIASAETTIPANVPIISLSFLPNYFIDETNWVESQFSIEFDDPATEENYYELILSSVAYEFDTSDKNYWIESDDPCIIGEQYYAGLLTLDLIGYKYLLFRDATFAGQRKIVKIHCSLSQELREDGYVYLTEDLVKVHLRNVSQEYFEYKTSVLNQMNYREENFLYGLGEPINASSNIQNGLGLFAGFNYDIEIFKIEEQMVSKWEY